MVLYPNKLPESERVCFGICNYYQEGVNLIYRIRKLAHDAGEVTILPAYSMNF